MSVEIDTMSFLNFYSMKITIVASIQFSKEMIECKHELEKQGHVVFVPYSTEKIAANELALEEYIKEKEAHGDMKFRKEGPDLIKDHYNKILQSDAIMVLNYTKKGIENYIGGNALMEMGFAYVNNKKIFLLHNIPDMPYTDEIRAVYPILLRGDITHISV